MISPRTGMWWPATWPQTTLLLWVAAWAARSRLIEFARHDASSPNKEKDGSPE